MKMRVNQKDYGIKKSGGDNKVVGERTDE